MLMIVSTVVAVIMAIFMFFLRMRVAQRPTTAKRIILPPIFMSTGAFMFILPMFRVPWIQVAEALFLGVVFSIFLIRTSHFIIVRNEIYLEPSKAFIFVLFGLLAVRTGIKLFLGRHITFGETSGMFFLLGFGMIITWRLAMLYKFKKTEQNLAVE